MSETEPPDNAVWCPHGKSSEHSFRMICKNATDIQIQCDATGGSRRKHVRCDQPVRLFASFPTSPDEPNTVLLAPRFAPNASFTLFTGDVVDHAVWDAGEQKIGADLRTWYGRMPPISYETFGNQYVYDL